MLDEAEDEADTREPAAGRSAKYMAARRALTTEVEKDEAQISSAIAKFFPGRDAYWQDQHKYKKMTLKQHLRAILVDLKGQGKQRILAKHVDPLLPHFTPPTAPEAKLKVASPEESNFVYR